MSFAAVLVEGALVVAAVFGGALVVTADGERTAATALVAGFVVLFSGLAISFGALVAMLLVALAATVFVAVVATFAATRFVAFVEVVLAKLFVTPALVATTFVLLGAAFGAVAAAVLLVLAAVFAASVFATSGLAAGAFVVAGFTAIFTASDSSAAICFFPAARSPVFSVARPSA